VCGEPRPFAARPSDALDSPIPEHRDWGPRSRPGFRVPIGTHSPPSFAEFAAQNRKCIVLQGLTDLAAAAELSVSFCNFPKLSVSFRFVPFRSVSFRLVPPGSGFCRGAAGGAVPDILVNRLSTWAVGEAMIFAPGRRGRAGHGT